VIGLPEPYRYTTNRSFEDYASGRVFYAQPGIPAFPVRLASEVFQRGLAHWRAAGETGPCRLYDPTCGGSYWLVVLAFLHWDSIASIFASDLEPDIVALAQRNLSLLTTDGLDSRIAEIEKMLADFSKDSHRAALESAFQFRRALEANLNSHEIHTRVFQANALDTQALRQGLGGAPIDLVLADVPYGWHSEWEGHQSGQEEPPVWQLLNALAEQVSPQTILAIAASKNQQVTHAAYQRLERFQVGKRRIVFLRLHREP
jgi:hypothetical protein